ncbi:YbaB/EbfC family nucleoid-associated protein [Leucobacter coleopterorum]|uniref:YbaB/EbfC family nucleoid-associated protein n=1 Tax=Leucobacter coleopterorum TaxID=2714933 RepID=A0ABX6JYQ7_9MICO|nr:YbaB/EbfC family nucleoid-associated protein [Leucobacter coleopterorum]QIM19353.1 YbaB/EbfC family nucleoid-associated protein [Leucobacter coleopterorum]
MSTEFSQDALEQARARIATQVAEAEARNKAVSALADGLSNISATATSPRGEVTATAKPDGKVTAVKFAPSAESLTASALSDLVTTVIAEAQHKAAMSAVNSSAETLGADSAFVAQLRRDAEVTFPSPTSGTIEYR